MPGEPCAGEVYTDDGHSFDFKQGAYARVKFTCTAAPDGSVHVNIAAQEGKWTPWWSAYRVEFVGSLKSAGQAEVNGHTVPMSQTNGRWGMDVPRTTAATSIDAHMQ